jgi:cytochrome c-type biogenesis protein CcmE
MNARKTAIIGLAVVFCGIAFYSMRGMLTPYVSFGEAMKSGEYVQVIGNIDRKTPLSFGEGTFSFAMEDAGGTVLTFSCTGPVPQNFDHATQAVALGQYDKVARLFIAEKLLIKCPSKYTKGKVQ